MKGAWQYLFSICLCQPPSKGAMAYLGDAGLTLCPFRVLPMVSGGAEIQQVPYWPAITSFN